MGQCWFRATKVNPLEKPEERRDSFEVTENESDRTSSQAGKQPALEKVPSPVPSRGKSQIIEVKPITNKDMSLKSLAPNYDMFSGRPLTSSLPKLPPLPASKTRKTSSVYPYKEKQTKFKKKMEWDVKEMTNVANTVEVKPKLSQQANERVMKTLVQDVSGNITVVEVKESDRKMKQDKWLGLVNGSNLLEHQSAEKSCSKEDEAKSSHEKVLVKDAQAKKVIMNQPKHQTLIKMEKKITEKIPENGNLENSQNETFVKTKMANKPSNAAEIAHLAVRSQIFAHLETKDGISRKTALPGKEMKEKEKVEQPKKADESPYWKLQDIPVQSACFASKEDIQDEMKSIESEMHALLKPEEKFTKRYVAFTIGKVDNSRSQTPDCVPQRLLKHRKSQVDHVKIQEKQRDAERRRNANIANRIKSARYRSALKKPSVPSDHEDDCDNDSQALKERVFEKMKAAHERRNDVMVKRVQFAKMSGSLRKEPEDNSEHENEIKMKVYFKIKAATDRRNEILNKRAHAAKKKGRKELVNEMEKKMVDVHKSKQEVKLNKIKENRERMLRRKLRSLAFQEKKRELARKQLARQKQEEEERCQTFFETETYDGDDDLGEHDWDFQDDHG